MKPKVLFVDDQVASMKAYVNWLRRSNAFELVVRSEVSRVFGESSPIQEPLLVGVILDLMMPAQRFSTLDPTGHRTGLLLLEEIRKLRPTLKCIFLTNAIDGTLLTEASACSNARLLVKLQTSPKQLLEEAEEFFALGEDVAPSTDPGMCI